MREETVDAGEEPVMTAEVAAEPAHIERLPQPDDDLDEADAASEQADDDRPRKGRGLQERFGELTGKISSEKAARAEAERRAIAAETLIRRIGEGAPRADTPPDVERLVTQRAEAMTALNAFTARSNAIHQAGVEAFPDFQARVEALQGSGVLSRANPTFLAAVMETDAPEKVLHHLGADPEAARKLASLPPLKLAAEVAKLGVKVSQPGYRPVSAAPAPISPIGGAGARRFDPLDETVPIDQWMREMDKRDAVRRGRR